nr:MAG TPA: microtubule-associated protein [Caudoviricetes sp.]
MDNNEVDLAEIFKHMRETIGNQAQEIAVLKASLAKLVREHSVEDKVE